MTEANRLAVRTKKPRPLEITFTCPRCHKKNPLEDMRSITRFVPMIIVCKQCEKEIR
jgi:transcription elongation factor Elf1